jgi:hypothetical protein
MLRLGALLAVLAVLMLGRTTASAASPVMHVGPDGGWQFVVGLEEDAASHMSVVMYVFYQPGRGDIFRTNPDGTLFLHTAANKADVHVVTFDTTDPNNWVVTKVYNGPGNFYSTYTAVVNDGWIQWDGQRLDWKVQADLQLKSYPAYQPLSDEIFPFSFQLVARDWTTGLFKLSFEPHGWDIHTQ